MAGFLDEWFEPGVGASALRYRGSETSKSPVLIIDNGIKADAYARKMPVFIHIPLVPVMA